MPKPASDTGWFKSSFGGSKTTNEFTIAMHLCKPRSGFIFLMSENHAVVESERVSA